MLRGDAASRARRPHPDAQESTIPQYVTSDHDAKKVHSKQRMNLSNLLLTLTRAPLQRCRVPPKLRSNNKTWTIVSLALVVCIILINSTTRTHSSAKDSQHYPITLQFHNDTIVSRLPLTNAPLYYIVDRTNNYWIDHGTYYHRRVHEPPSNCQPFGDWQTIDNNLNCNSFHEIDLVDFTKITLAGDGGFMIVWGYQEFNGQKRALKMLLYEDDLNFNHVGYQDQRHDALAAATLSASPYVADVFGFCGRSSVSDFSERGILWWLFDDNDEPSKEELFRIAYDVAKGVYDAQHYDNQNRATLAHMDIKANQFIFLDGMYKLNDFNLCQFLMWDPDNKEYCGFENGYTGRWQAPEQAIDGYLHKSERADTFSLGYTLYFLLTKQKPFKGTNGDDVQDLVRKGQRPYISSKIRKSTHPFDVAVREMVNQCLAIEPHKRPSSKEVAEYLHDALLKAGLAPTPIRKQSDEL